MNRATWLQGRRMLKFRDVLNRWERRELSMMEAGELLGMSERQFRRYRERFEEEGEQGLVDRRLGQPSPKRIEATEIARMLGALPDDVSGLEREAFPRARGARSQVCVGLHLDQGAAACRRTGGAGEASRRASAQA